MKGKSKIFLIILLSILSVSALYFITLKIEKHRRTSSFISALEYVLEERGEKGLLEMAGADIDSLYYMYEDVPAYIEGSGAWNRTDSELRQISIYKGVAPSVVRIVSTKDGIRCGEGAGVVYSSDGYIVTVSHVLGTGNEFRVFFNDGSSSDAALVGSDDISDISVLKTDRTDLKPIAMGYGATEGSDSYIIGHPFGNDWSFGRGMITGTGRMVLSPNGFVIPGMLQTDAPVNPGNSGGPLISSDGRMIGLISSTYSPNGSGSGVAFALSSEYVAKDADSIIKNGRASHGWIDAILIELNDAILSHEDLPVSEGLLVSQTLPAGGADRGGIRGGTRKAQYGQSTVYLGGDVIISINGIGIRGFEDYFNALFGLESGTPVDIEVVRNGRTVLLEGVVLAEENEENSGWLIR